MIGAWILILGLCAIAAGAQEKPLELRSPDGKIALNFRLAEGGAPVYAVSYQGKPVIVESGLGLKLKGGPDLTSGLSIASEKRESRDETWTPVAAERSPIRDHYNQLAVTLAGEGGWGLELVFRAYDEGVAFRITLPARAGAAEFTITDEASEFRFAGDWPCWPVYAAQAQYKPGLKLSDVKPNCERPLTVEVEGGPAVAVGEAGLLDFSRMRLQPAGRPHGVRAHLGGEVTAVAPFSTPWRFVAIADTPGGLLERNHLTLNLNEPSRIKDTSWIKPGKVIREVSLSTAGGKACVDFAVARGLQYIEYDAGWYGAENDKASDARGVHLDPSRSKGPLDLREVIDYGKSKGIGVILYVNHLALEKQAAELFPLYHQWGVKGVKYGFVNVGPQQWTRWIAENLQKCADNQLMVDIHDEYRNTGISRTFPNLMTTEGVGGDEEFPPAEHVCALPFTRALCGTFDNTICMFDRRLTSDQKNKRGELTRKSRCFQLAKAVVVFSPWQFMYWYDRPEAYRGEPELEFWKAIPTVWDETRVVNGAIGRTVTEARRGGKEWFVGTLNAGERRTVKIPLDFLEAGKKYRAWICADADPAGAELTGVKIEERAVETGTVIQAEVGAVGGHVMRIREE